MNRENIIKLAREAGAGLSTSAIPLEHPWVFLPDELERFAALVAAHEREACAQVCDGLWQDDGTAYDCREAIRARGKV